MLYKKIVITFNTHIRTMSKRYENATLTYSGNFLIITESTSDDDEISHIYELSNIKFITKTPNE